MSNRKPNFSVGEKVTYLGMPGIVDSVLLISNKYTYTVRLRGGTKDVPEGKLKRA